MNISDYDKYDTTIDPCPECGAEVTQWSLDNEIGYSNRESVLSIRNPACPHQVDPSADCTCTPVINPAPNPAFDRPFVAMSWMTLGPCGHRFIRELLDKAGWKTTYKVRPGWHQKQLERLLADAAQWGVTLDLPASPVS